MTALCEILTIPHQTNKPPEYKKQKRIILIVQTKKRPPNWRPFKNKF